jgi:hypothetical protein
MRQSISSALAALAAVTVSAVPAMACGFSACTPCASPCAQSYAPAYSYAPTYGGCGTGCNTGWAFEHLAEPATQYYYVNQGPTYGGPGAFAPVPSYEDSAVTGWDGYRTQPYYAGAGVEGPMVYGYRWHHHPYHWSGYRYGYTAYHHGYVPYYYGHRVLRRYY